jgi:hypothetical protein
MMRWGENQVERTEDWRRGKDPPRMNTKGHEEGNNQKNASLESTG